MATALFNNPTSVSTSVGNTEDGRCNFGSCRKKQNQNSLSYFWTLQFKPLYHFLICCTEKKMEYEP